MFIRPWILFFSILLAVLSLTGVEGSQLAKFQGGLSDGVELSTLVSGGSTLSVYLEEEAFIANISNELLVEEVSSGFLADAVPNFSQQVKQALLSGYASISGSRRHLKLRLGPMPKLTLERDSQFTFRVPNSILSKDSERIQMASTIFVGVNASSELLTVRPIVGSEVSIRITGTSADKITVVQGMTCRGDAARIRGSRIEEDILKFVPLRGGPLAFCVEKGLRKFQLRGGAITVAGAEGFSTDPSQPRSSKQFFTNVFGIDMNEQDSISLSPQGCTKSDSPDSEFFELEFYSPTRAGFFATVPVTGEYHVCYLRYGAQSFVDLGMITIERGGDSVIDGDARLINIEHDTILARNARVESLSMTGGSLLLDHFHLNVSRFEWLGGSIHGPGTITITGDVSLIRRPDTLQIDFSLRNAGRLRINAMGILISSTGGIINSGKIIFESQTIADGGLSIESQMSHNIVRNSPSGTIIFHGGDGGAFRIDSPLLNYGAVVLHDGALSCSTYTGHRGSLFEVGSNAHFSISRGTVQGVVSLGVGSQCTLSPAKRQTIELSGAHFRLSDSSIVELVSGTVLLVSSRFEGTGAVSLGSDTDLDLRMEGTNIFTFGTTVGFRNTRLTSPVGCTLIFYGNVAVNLENTIIGDNVVIQSRLAAIMFAKGQSATRLMPLKSPQNTSLVVPANTTLVIVDTGVQLTDDVAPGPVICSYFVVIPMYVAAEGDVLLKGCAMLPFGGALNGMVFGSGFDSLEASIKTAFCRTALLGGEGCVAASALGLPLSSGLVLSGHFRSDPKVTSSFHLDYLKLLNGSLGVGKQIAVYSPHVEISPESSLLLENGGVIASDRLVLRGLLEAQNILSIRGNLDAREGILRVPHASGCYFPVTVDGEAQYDRAVVQCSTPPLSPMTGALIKSESYISTPRVDQATCSSASMVARVVLDQQSGLVLEVTESAFQTSFRLRATLLAVILATLGLCAWAVGFSLDDLLSSPPMKIDLMWTEFSMFMSNIIVALGCGMEVVILCAPAFLHSVPNTFIFGWFSKMASSVIEPRGSSSSAPLSVLLTLLVYAWLLAWIPLSRKQLGHFIDENMSEARRKAIRMLFQFHTTIVLVAPPAFVPTLSLLTETVACSTLYNTAHSCQSLNFPSWPFVIASLLFVGLSLFSGANCGFPFGHPPYQRDLDVRFKRSYVIARYALLAMLVGLWKLVGPDRVVMLSSSFVVIFILFCVTCRSKPSGYRNVNTIVSRGLLFPLWAHVCALLSEFHSSQSAVCPDTDYAFVLMVAVGWLLVAVAIIYWIGGNRTSGTEDERIGLQLRMIIDASQKIEECRSDMYNAATDSDREGYSHTLSALKLRHLQQLTLFRHKKESMLLAYYLGEQAAVRNIANAQGPLPAFDDETEFDPVTKLTFRSPPSQAEAEMSPLSIDLMDSYVRGPILGKGSYGTVYMGMLSTTGRLLAVKEVRISSRKKEVLERVKKEVECLQSVSHPNIIQYYGCRTKGGMVYVFMELATGGSLTSIVRKFGGLQESVVGVFVHQILTGLAYLHSRGIVHRDVKGDNILMDGNGVAKLADFGCSKLLAHVANGNEEGCGTLIGSPYWMAPEVIRSEAYGTKADIWSLGCTVVEMLNGGEPAWKEKFESAYAAMYHIGIQSQDPPNNIPEGVSQSCKDFLAKCFERDALKRADATELLSHPWLQEAQNSTNSVLREFSSASVSMESNTRSNSPTADASYEREMSPFP